MFHKNKLLAPFQNLGDSLWTLLMWRYIEANAVLIMTWNMFISVLCHSSDVTCIEVKSLCRQFTKNRSLLLKTHLWLERSLYCCAHCADRELCLISHDISGLDVTVIHRVLESGSSVGVLMAGVTIEGYFGPFSASKQDILPNILEEWFIINHKNQCTVSNTSLV